MNVSLAFTFANGNAAITSSFSQSTPTVIRSWHVHTAGDACSTSRIPDGAAVGCEDGSLYFLRSSTRAVQRRISTGSLADAASSAKAKETPSLRSPRHLLRVKIPSIPPQSGRAYGYIYLLSGPSAVRMLLRGYILLFDLSFYYRVKS